LEIVYKTSEQIDLIRISSLLVGNALATVAAMIRPGITTDEMDAVAEDYIRSNAGTPSFKNYKGYPKSLCISVNEEVVHGIPGKRVLKEGDVVSVDCGVFKNGYHGDSAYTFAIGPVSDEVEKLMKVTKESLFSGIEQAVAGNRLGDVSSAIQAHAEANNFGVVRELVGHGIGKRLHEKPEVPNYGKRGGGIVLKEGLVIAIEPMINQGKKNVKQLEDGWTITTADRLPSAHYEHTIAVQSGKADVLSSFKEIEEAVKLNKHLIKI
jgi:methionyl aminopeptidase